jgi:hypothetical protein
MILIKLIYVIILLLGTCIIIGVNHCFQNVYVNINRILTVASRMMEGGHYAASHIRSVASRLDRAWKEFAAGLDERTAVLALSVLFHHKAEQVSIICF